jgi:ketosteroid isomerase-like protein
MLKQVLLAWSLILAGLAVPTLAVETSNGVSAQENTGAVADRLAIRELIESYNAAVIEKDATKWIANWVEDGIWNLGGGNIEGKDRILESWLTIMAPYEHASVFSQPIFIKVAGDEGTAHWHTNERLKLYSGDEMLAVGRYKDRYVRINGVWKIKQRDYSVVFTSARAATSSEHSQP